MKPLACKFGGSSVADAKQILKVKQIVDEDPRRRFIVVSAPGKRNDKDKKVTDMLYVAHETAKAELDPSNVLKLIEDRYQDIITDLGIELDLTPEFEEIKLQLGIESRDYAASRGEYLNGLVIAKALGAEFINPADTIFFGSEGHLDEAKTYEALAEAMSGAGRYVIPGFFGMGTNGRVKTFSRGGSDITGAIVARAMEVATYENWTDVNGLLMADPRIVENPLHVEEVSYSELRELSYMGAQVLHDEAIFPVREIGIPVHIRNTNQPELEGTRIVSKVKHRATPIVGLAGKEDFEAITIQKTLMNKEIGFGRRLLEIFERHQCNFEHLPSGIDSISVIVNSSEIDDKRESILKEISQNLKVDELNNFRGIALIAVVGAGMAYHPGVAATVFSALSNEGINIRLIDQGAMELNIILGVEEKDFKKAIRSIYKAFIK